MEESEGLPYLTFLTAFPSVILVCRRLSKYLVVLRTVKYFTTYNCSFKWSLLSTCLKMLLLLHSSIF